MEMETKENIDNKEHLLKNKVQQKGIEELLQPHFWKILDGIINATKLVLYLYNKKVMNRKQRDQCVTASTSFVQNLELIKIVIEQAAGEEFVDGLQATGNFYVLQLLQASDDLESKAKPVSISYDAPIIEDVPKAVYPPTVTTGSQSDFTQDSILMTAPRMRETPCSLLLVKLRRQNMAMMKDDNNNVDGTLAKVTTVYYDGNSTCSKYFFPEDFHPEEHLAITNFLKSQLCISLDLQTVARSPKEIYIDTLFFTHQEWEWLSKLLLNHCQDFLEKLWLDQVALQEYCQGTNWIENEEEQTTSSKVQPRFNSLKFYTIFCQGSDTLLDSETFNSLLLLIKPRSLLLNDFWNLSKCQVQVWNARKLEVLQIWMDPLKSTLYLDNLSDNLKDEFDFFFLTDKPRALVQSLSNTICSPLLKMWYIDPRVNLFHHGGYPRMLTHLCLAFNFAPNFNYNPSDPQVLHPPVVIDELLKNLGQFSRLQKLALGAPVPWTIDLNDLKVLKNLSFLFLDLARINSDGVGVDLFNWNSSLKTIVLVWCEFALSSPEQAWSWNNQAIKLERIQGRHRHGNSVVGEPGKLFEMSMLSRENAYSMHLLPHFF